MVCLRRLEEKDAPYMLEWMQNEEINRNFFMNFAEYTIAQANQFIQDSFNEKNRHFAIADENDEYQGTISLKNIDMANRNAEYAIVLRLSVIHTGVSSAATNLILNYAFRELQLNKVYLNVLSENKRAIRFYRKQGFLWEGTSREHIFLNGCYRDLEWYAMFRQDDKRG